PERSTTPARIFVPPRSTPMTRSADTRGYHNAPNARPAEALSPVSGRPGQGQSPAGASARASRGRRPGRARRKAFKAAPLAAAALSLDARAGPGAADTASAGSPVGRGQLLLALEGHQRGERPCPSQRHAAAGAPERAAQLHGDDDPRPRHGWRRARAKRIA